MGWKKTWFKRFSILIALVIAVFIAALLLIDTRYYAKYALSKVQTELRKQGVFLEAKDPDFHFFGINSGETKITFQDAPFFPLTFEKTKISFWKSSKIASGLNISIDSNAYHGIVQAQLDSAVDLKESLVSVDLKGLDLASYPTIQFAGFRKGTLDAKILNASTKEGQLVKAEGEFNVSTLEHPLPVNIPLKKLGIPGGIPMPGFSIEKFSAELLFEPESLKISKISLRSSLGEGSGRMVLVLNKSGIAQTIEADFKVNLTTDGLQAFGPLIQVASQNRLNAQTSRFAILIRGNAQKPQVQFQPY